MFPPCSFHLGICTQTEKTDPTPSSGYQIRKKKHIKGRKTGDTGLVARRQRRWFISSNECDDIIQVGDVHESRWMLWNHGWLVWFPACDRRPSVGMLKGVYRSLYSKYCILHLDILTVAPSEQCLSAEIQSLLLSLEDELRFPYIHWVSQWVLQDLRDMSLQMQGWSWFRKDPCNCENIL